MSRLDDWGLRELWYRIGDIFARRNEAGASLSFDGSSLSLNSVSGGYLDSVNLDNGLATDSEAGHSLGIDGRTITLYNVNGSQVGRSVTVPNTDVSDKANVAWVRDNCIGSVGLSKVNKTIIITFYDLNGNYQDSVSFTV